MMRRARRTSWSKKELHVLFKTAEPIFSSKELFVRRAPASLAASRFLMVASKKVGSAPQRNKIRRRLRELFHEVLTTTPYDWIFFVRRAACTLPFKKLKEYIISLLQS